MRTKHIAGLAPGPALCSPSMGTYVLSTNLIGCASGVPEIGQKQSRQDRPWSTGYGVGLLLLCALLFVVAKAATQIGAIAITDIEYWLIGIVPIALVAALQSERMALTASGHPILQPSALKFAIVAWALALFFFAALHLFSVGNELERPLFELFGYRQFWPGVLRSVAYIGVASLIAVIPFRYELSFWQFMLVVTVLSCGFSSLFWL
ncbi:hypothetical protein [Mesorhizobium sp. 113-3-3]|uniref:hypothetical protein n=1 Tax=Mesorhizobium sp. 113-3-3 TaxID=2744516 RepID=UPI0019276E1A|nr:hypothetical protein [Mesorhizobium sp. 113-3-3]BCG80600.1 hypothetical protein MesoLj113b_41420 [Mesorhizobium sp. 113-3-3]